MQQGDLFSAPGALGADKWEIRGHRRDGSEGIYCVLAMRHFTATVMARDNPTVALVCMRTGESIEGITYAQRELLKRGRNP